MEYLVVRSVLLAKRRTHIAHFDLDEACQRAFFESCGFCLLVPTRDGARPVSSLVPGLLEDLGRSGLDGAQGNVVEGDYARTVPFSICLLKSRLVHWDAQ